MKIAVATPPYPASSAEGIRIIENYAKEASAKGAVILCFPETYLPGYPTAGRLGVFGKETFEAALASIQQIARDNHVALIVPMDAYLADSVLNVAYVFDAKGNILGYQAKNQLDPSEDALWSPGTERKLFETAGLKFGIVICHEGFRYPETVRWAAMQGAQVVFHPFFGGSNEPGVKRTAYGEKEGTYYEKAQMCRALENTIYVATSNNAFTYPEAASAIIDPEGNCIAYQEYGTAGVLLGDIDLTKATGLLAKRYKGISADPNEKRP